MTSSKLAVETLEQVVKYVKVKNRCSVFIVSFEYISHFVLVFIC